MVEALAPGTAETPEPTPAIGTDSRKEEILGTAAAAQEKVVEPVTEAVKATAEAVESKVTPAAKPEVAPTEAAVETPKEVTAEHVLPVAPEAAPIAPVVPVPVLPLTVNLRSRRKPQKQRSFTEPRPARLSKSHRHTLLPPPLLPPLNLPHIPPPLMAQFQPRAKLLPPLHPSLTVVITDPQPIALLSYLHANLTQLLHPLSPTE
ncbi:hypothetical protein BC629DRAFT_705797 [Irpex lacteus]|nr:hypothetical protein BC629DRAFT_705797 [Irpex lacteus]